LDTEFSVETIDGKLRVLQERIVALGNIGHTEVSAVRAFQVKYPAVARRHPRDIGMRRLAAREASTPLLAKASQFAVQANSRHIS
jgi:hypothetical protein